MWVETKITPRLDGATSMRLANLGLMAKISRQCRVSGFRGGIGPTQPFSLVRGALVSRFDLYVRVATATFVACLVTDTC